MDDHTVELVNLVYSRYHHKKFIGYDPVGFLQFYPQKEDREIVALVGALLAFGRVEQIHEKVGRVISWMKPCPRLWIENFERSILDGIRFSHRFVDIEDLITLFRGLKSVLKRWHSLELCFNEAWDKSGRDMIKALYIFREMLSDGFKVKCQMFLPDPAKKSTCKRWLLFLRWMVRKDEIDPGGWNSSISPKDLIVPVDVHMSKVAKRLGFSNRKTADWRMAVEITSSLRYLDPLDPVKYDFSLTRWSMEGFPDIGFDR